jgi:hypothetical protein
MQTKKDFGFKPPIANNSPVLVKVENHLRRKVSLLRFDDVEDMTTGQQDWACIQLVQLQSSPTTVRTYVHRIYVLRYSRKLRHKRAGSEVP